MTKEKLMQFGKLSYEVKSIGKKYNMNLHETMLVFHLEDREMTIKDLMNEIQTEGGIEFDEKEITYAKIFFAKIIKSLTEKGIVQKQKSEHDKRFVNISLTEEGLKIWKENYG